MHRCAALFMTFCLWSATQPPARAQSSGFDVARTSFTSVRAYIAADATPAQFSPPPNVVMSDTYRALVETMLSRSSTFRRQCARIASERGLLVRVSISTPSWRSDFRATTRMIRQDNGHLTAYIAIGPKYDVVELIAHELEHVIEQLDGVDLAQRAAAPHSGVSQLSGTPGIFETQRATRIGQRVSAEVRE